MIATSIVSLWSSRGSNSSSRKWSKQLMSNLSMATPSWCELSTSVLQNTWNKVLAWYLLHRPLHLLTHRHMYKAVYFTLSICMFYTVHVEHISLVLAGLLRVVFKKHLWEFFLLLSCSLAGRFFRLWSTPSSSQYNTKHAATLASALRLFQLETFKVFKIQCVFTAYQK